MKVLSLIFIISFTSFYGLAQENISITEDNFGPNKTNFVHSYINFGFMSPPNSGDGAEIIYGKSHSFIYGIKYKYKILNAISIGLGINYNYQTWHLKQDISKIIPSNILYNKEKICSNNVGGEFFMRINIGERTNTIGNYIDIAPYGEWGFNNSHKITNNSDNNTPLGEEYNTITNINLNYIENFNYGLQLKIGLGRIALTGKYRLSNMFTENFKILVSSTELPRLIIGIEIGLHE